jgi:hypothetical protein
VGTAWLYVACARARVCERGNHSKEVLCVPRNKSVTDTAWNIGASNLTSHDTPLCRDVAADGPMLML